MSKRTKKAKFQTWVLECRVFTEYGWSDWEPTYDHDSGPYDTFRGAFRNCESLRLRHGSKKDWQFRVAKYERVERAAPKGRHAR